MGNLDTKRLLIIFIVAMVLVSGSIVFYNNNAIKKVQSDYNTKIAVLNRDILKSINELQQNLEEELFSIQSNLSLKLNLVENNLNSFRKQNEQEIDTLSDIIEQIEQQSNIQLAELKQELSSIQVESGDFSAIIDEIN